ncbi:MULTISPECIES: TonB-dependent receptor [Sphingomonas]|uniref:TonB-dependent receptor n=1 Tax=Sphingomonas TaxID=13687 RepID=UPI000F7F45B2|nr:MULTISPECIES: TonB-dependent receptor [Sphingomonas]RSV26880.1 TonB-dependent receptor [Sphingomonas sp. ABOLH]WCP73117.1 TonB-dependent receptor [Sphingomonas hankookensis]
MAFSRFAYLASTALVALATPAFAQEAPAPTTTDDADTITVTGIRKSIADSIATKRDAGSIVDVISAEDVGKFPDANVADSLARLPGVTVDRQFGEGEQLSIAGVEPALNRLTVDGHSVASADWGGNPSDRSSRTFNYSLLSPTIISQAVVYKTPEARLQEGAIGASVDVVTRKPLDLKSGTIAATAGGEYNDRAKRGSFRGSALYSWHNADDTIGFLGSVSYDKEQLSRAGSAVYWYRTGDALLANAPNTATINGKNITALTAAERASFSSARFASFLAREFFKQERERIGFSGAVQARPTDNLTVTATGLFIRGNYDNVSNSAYTYGFEGSRLISAQSSDGLVTSATFAGIPTGQAGATGQLDTNYRRTRLKNDSVTLLVDWTPGDWTINGNVGGTKATGGKDPEYLLDFRTQQGFTSGANGQNTVVNWAKPASDPSMWLSNFTAVGGENLGAQDLARNGGQQFFGRQIGGIPLQSGFTMDQEKFAEINFKHPVEFGPIKEILFGGRYVDHDNKQTTYSNAVFTNQNFTLADLPYYVLPGGLYNGLGVSGNGTPYATLDKDGIIAALAKYGNKQIDRGFSFNEFFGVNEKIAAAYAQANFETGKFRGNVGVRFAHTSDEAKFYTASNRAGQLFPIYTYTPVKNDYNRLLPSANVIYQAGDDVVLRASAAKVLARQRYSDLAGSLSLDDNQLSGSGGNPALKPYEATNYGLSAEWYFAPASFLAAEFFYRDISNYTVNQVNNETQFNVLLARNATYAVSRPVNGGTAQVTGFSLSGNTNLIWGFGFQGSYTFADAEASLATGLPYLSRHTLQLSPYYENGPFQARVSYNRRSKYFYRFGRQSSQDYTDAYRQLDAQISYALTEGVSITAQASNLLDETYYQYSSTPNAPTSVYKNGRVFSLNATFRM